MIVVFVVDTSPSMKKPLLEGSTERSAGSGMSRLDLAKMAVEDLTKGMNRRVNEHNSRLQNQSQLQQKSSRNLGLGFIPNDEFLLLSTGRQHTQQPATAACGAGGRLLVGYGTAHLDQHTDHSNEQPVSHPSNAESFQRELKKLQATEWDPSIETKPGSKGAPNVFPDDGGGAKGLNVALSSGLQLLSRYRLNYRSTENFGMGRLPSTAILNPSGGPATNALQPACLVLITDGACLRVPPSEGGGSLQLQYGNMPLKEFYQEPFRWDQRIFCLGVGAKEGVTSSQFLHPHLRALCEVTGGGHLLLNSKSPGSLSKTTDLLLDLIAPPLPRDLPIQAPLSSQADHSPIVGSNGSFVEGGPVCCFQALEPDIDGGQPTKHRAMILYVPHHDSSDSQKVSKEKESFQSPVWCIPENFFPSKKLDTLPPRPAQPLLNFSRYPQQMGSRSFDTGSLIKSLNRLDQLTAMNRSVPTGSGTSSQNPPQVKLLHRDVYICEWVSLDGEPGKAPTSLDGNEYFPVLVPGAGRTSLSEGEVNFLNIGILHIPSGTSTLASSLSTGVRVSTLTLLPPEPHILLPLLIRAAEAEHRAQKKGGIVEAKEALAAGKAGATAALVQKQTASSRNVLLDDQWRTEFRAYLFRMPPYYQNALKRSLRSVLPASVHSLLNADATEGSLASQCFSKLCLQKIRNAEQATRETVERLERQESELRRRGNQFFEHEMNEQQHRQPGMKPPNAKPYPVVGYGQYDPRSSTESFLAALRNMPAPWRVGVGGKSKDEKKEGRFNESDPQFQSDPVIPKYRSAVDALGDLPANCLMAYYESRRRWIFGGSSFSTRGLFVEGVSNDGSNSQRCPAKADPMEQSLLSIAGVGVSSMNQVSTTRMGEYRERLLWSRAPVVGVGSNDSAGVAATTAQNGAPRWSVDDDAMPVAFFDPKTGEFADSVQARVRSRLMVNFGNPYRDKRADSIIPEKFSSQRPTRKQGFNSDNDDPLTPPGSPPHDTFSASEGEGEAVFSRTSPSRKSPRPHDFEESAPSEPKRQKVDSKPPAPESPPVSPGSSPSSQKKVKSISTRGPPPPPPPPKGPPNKPPPPTGSATSKPPRPLSQGPPPPKPPQVQQKRPPAPNSKPVHADKPADTQTGESKEQKGNVKSVSSMTSSLDLQSPDKKPAVDLPPGWMCVWSKSQKRWYFFDTKSNKSVWQWPPPK